MCRTWLLSYIYSETVVTSEPARTFNNAEPRWSGGLSVYVDTLCWRRLMNIQGVGFVGPAKWTRTINSAEHTLYETRLLRLHLNDGAPPQSTIQDSRKIVNVS